MPFGGILGISRFTFPTILFFSNRDSRMSRSSKRQKTSPTMTSLTDSPAWKDLQKHYSSKGKSFNLRDQFNADPNRFSK